MHSCHNIVHPVRTHHAAHNTVVYKRDWLNAERVPALRNSYGIPIATPYVTILYPCAQTAACMEMCERVRMCAAHKHTVIQEKRTARGLWNRALTCAHYSTGVTVTLHLKAPTFRECPRISFKRAYCTQLLLLLVTRSASALFLRPATYICAPVTCYLCFSG